MLIQCFLLGIWSVHGDCKQQLSLTGHQGPVLDLKWFKNSHNMVSVSADFTVCLWDMEANGERIRRWKGHQSYVQSVAVSPVNQEDGQLCASGADDGYIKVIAFLVSFLWIKILIMSDLGFS